ncbi:MAG: GFA family protein [Aliidongia sp.]
MSDAVPRYIGGCLCGALRYEAEGEPLYAGHCYCADCQKASGSGFIPFIGFASSAVRFSGPTRPFTSKAASGGDAVRNSCPICSSLVFGGEVGKSDSFTIYAGSLDDPSLFHPTVAIFARNQPPWAIIPPGMTVFQEMPSGDRPAHE